MTEADRYNFKDFTEAGYAALLAAMKRRYAFRNYRQAAAGKGDFIVLRHDIDFSPQRALALAKIEQRLAVRATYCVQLGSPFYNVFEKDVKKVLMQITKLGHYLGLHFSPGDYEIKNFRQMEKLIRLEKGVLEDLLGVKIQVLSFHNPAKGKSGFARPLISGLLNSYSAFFLEGMKYISDSNGYWRHERLHTAVVSGAYKRLHVLIHPCWWQKRAMSPWKRIIRCAEGRKESMLYRYTQPLDLAGRKNIGYARNNIRR
jgi:hypothetical protein